MSDSGPPPVPVPRDPVSRPLPPTPHLAPTVVPLGFLPAPKRRGFGIASLVLGILLVAGELIWLVFGAIFLAALVWIFPVVLVFATIILAIHVIVALIALVLGVLAIARDRGRVAGIVGLVLTVATTFVVVVIGIFFWEFVGVLYG